MPEEKTEDALDPPIGNKTDNDQSLPKNAFPLKEIFDQALEHAKEIRKKYSDEHLPEAEE